MKKFLQFVPLFIVLLTVSKITQAQCDVKDAVITLVGVPQQQPLPANGCSVSFDLTFKLNNNNGNKTVVIQAWKEADYPNYWNCNAQGTSAENKAPKAADLRKKTAPYTVQNPGPLPFLNIAFDVALNHLWDDETQIIWACIVSFWFGGQAFKK